MAIIDGFLRARTWRSFGPPSNAHASCSIPERSIVFSAPGTVGDASAPAVTNQSAHRRSPSAISVRASISAPSPPPTLLHRAAGILGPAGTCRTLENMSGDLSDVGEILHVLIFLLFSFLVAELPRGGAGRPLCCRDRAAPVWVVPTGPVGGTGSVVWWGHPVWGWAPFASYSLGREPPARIFCSWGALGLCGRAPFISAFFTWGSGWVWGPWWGSW